MNPFRLITVASSRSEKVGRAQGDSVITTAQGDDDRDYDSEFWATHGIVSRPAKTTRAIRFRFGPLSIVIAAYTYGVEPPANPGACKLYSTDENGAEKASHLLDADGKHTFNNGEDWAVRYSKLETAFNELKSQHNKLQAAYDLHTHGGVETGTGTTAAPAPSGAASTADITAAKVEEILIP